MSVRRGYNRVGYKRVICFFFGNDFYFYFQLSFLITWFSTIIVIELLSWPNGFCDSDSDLSSLRFELLRMLVLPYMLILRIDIILLLLGRGMYSFLLIPFFKRSTSGLFGSNSMQILRVLKNKDINVC
jgi:hypothetical protein